MRCVRLGCLLLLLSLGLCQTAAAQDGPGKLLWSSRWTRFSTAQYMLTGALAGGMFAANSWLRPASGARWQTDILLDAQARSLFGANTEVGRERASGISDYLRTGLVLYPFVIDSLLIAGIAHRSPDVAFQIGMISLQGMLLAKLITNLSKSLASRARPDDAGCVQGSELACDTRNESFISGHTSGAFAGAGLICAHHEHLKLYGSWLAGTIACGGALGLATTVGTLRMVSDRHHLSDVLAGAAIGFGAGYLMTKLTNYHFGSSPASDDSPEDEELSSVTPLVDNRTLGLMYSRSF